jgi:3-keto-disaccharide hydrolase
VRTLGLALLAMGIACGAAAAADPQAEKWVPMFNGKDLSGWTPKFAGYAVGENPFDTFRVANGNLVVSYDGYSEFGDRFGHLFYDRKLSHYRIRFEYRFQPKEAQVKGGPAWGLMNSGLMLHCQSAASMRKDQFFPVSIEAQLLGDDGTGTRGSGNMCSPGTHVVMNGKLEKEHCPRTSTTAVAPGQWTRFEVEVHGSNSLKHLVNGVVTAEYKEPQYDADDPDGKAQMAGKPLVIGEGYVALQAESHPVEFRNVELLELAP